EAAREQGEALPEAVQRVYEALAKVTPVDPANTVIGSTIYARKPGDGSAREQAASCQRVLGAAANIAGEYATKRYRSNCINWGMTPLQTKDEAALSLGCWVFVPGLRKAILSGETELDAYVVAQDGDVRKTHLFMDPLTPAERQIIADGCLINYYRSH
ncbi:MAG: hydratase, partial [Candidatus Ventricola sp.]|nr:hydratase [Candidatus Ventricola sp.]